MKITKTSSLPFDAVKEHQVRALWLSKHRKINYKIPDDSMGQKPFDCFVLKGVEAYVVVMFYVRGCKDFYMIDIDDFIQLKKTSTRKSFTEDMLEGIAVKVTF